MILSMGSIALAFVLSSAGVPENPEIVPEGPTLGWDARIDNVEAVAAAIPEGLSGRLVVRLTAEWPEIERQPGVYDWTAVRGAASRLDLLSTQMCLCQA